MAIKTLIITDEGFVTAMGPNPDVTQILLRKDGYSRHHRT